MTDHAYWDRERQEGPTDWGPGRADDLLELDHPALDLAPEFVCKASEYPLHLRFDFYRKDRAPLFRR
jgi:hypothetical protein